MKLKDWIMPGAGIKRWILQMVIGIFLISYAIIEFFSGEKFIGYSKWFLLVIFVLGILITCFSLKKYTSKIKTIMRYEALNFSMGEKEFNEEIFKNNILVKGPKVVVIGGGTGLSNMLSGLKKYTSNITAIVTVADDGGGSGVLRQDLGILPPGDIRNCITALADTEPLMEQLFRYRFKDGSLENQSFGNLFLAAMNGISENFLEAIKKTSDVLAVTGKVLPVTLDNVELYAKLKNGDVIRGESSIPKESLKRNSPIKEVFIKPKHAKGVPEAIEAIREADAVIIGPGSLYTSIIPNLMVEDIKEAIIKTEALRIYVSNIITQPGESDNFSVQDHIRAIMKHCKGISIDFAVVNKIADEKIKDVRENYLNKDNSFVELDSNDHSGIKTEYIECDMLKIKNNCLRHHEDKLARILMDTIMEKKMVFDEERVFEYIYLLQRLRKEEKGRELE